LTRHSGSLQKNRLIALERAAAADVEYEFADGSSSPANATIVGVGVGPDVAYRGRFELRADSRAHAHLHGAGRVLGSLARRAHGVRIFVEPLLHRLEYVLVFAARGRRCGPGVRRLLSNSGRH
jgi:hypothetical protein